MKQPELPADEKNRIVSLCGLEILDTPKEKRFDRITRIAQSHFKVKICLVSLVDTDRQWFKSKQGLDAAETPRDISFCGHAILGSNIFHIPDALKDPRFADNPLVTGPPNIRFYAGAPLHAPDGQRIGTLCIIDDKPRDFSPEDLGYLRDLADDVENELLKCSPRKSFTILQKLILGAVLLMLFSAGVVGGLFYNRTTGLLAEHALEDMSREIQHAGDMLNTIISTHDEDVLFLASTPPIQGLLRAQSEGGYDTQDNSSASEWVSRLETIFRSQLRRKSTYQSIRFINAMGQELVVVSRQGNEIVSASGKQLQDKAGRIYVSEALKLPAGSVYVSEMNLNREFGKVSLPHQEVIRSATPVYDDRDSSLAGLVSITIEIGGKLRTIQDRVRRTRSNEIYITNNRGDYLLHPDSSKTYGFDLGNNYRIQEDLPQLTSLFLPDNPDPEMTLWYEDADGRQVLDFTKISFDANNPARFIAVVITHNYSSIIAEQSRLLNNVVLWALLSCIAGIVVSILFAVNLTRPINQITTAMSDYIHQRNNKNIMPVTLNNEIGLMARIYQTLIGQVELAHAHLREMNNELEARVAERTNELKMSEIRQRSIVENIVDGLITIDASGAIESFNPAASAIFGYSTEEVMGKNVKMLMPEPYTSEHDGYLHNYLSTGEKKVIGIGREVTGRRKDGSTFPMELAVSEMDINGERMFTGIVRDITERKKVEKIKSEFISTVSHELRTPLTSIRGALGLVLGGASGELPDKAKNMLEMASRNSERLTLLINDILDLEKLESGKIALNISPVDLDELARQSIESNQGYALEHDVRLEYKGSITGAMVNADSHRLLQVFANLVSNAIKYSPGQGVVDVSVSRNNGRLRVGVRDYGAGISSEFRSRIFQRFSQADSSDSREKGGTGLGLNISKVIVEQHGGNIGFLSPDGGGTEFYFDLPEISAVTGMSAVTENGKSDNGKNTILICEDNADVAEILATMLEQEGISSEIAGTAAEAKQLITKKKFAALLLDLGLPDQDGLELIQELRQDANTARLPVVVVSARAEEGKLEFDGDGFAVLDWIQKPVDARRLKSALQLALSSGGEPRVLHVEDSLDIVQIVQKVVSGITDYQYATTLKDARRLLDEQDFDLLIIDMALPDGCGLDLLQGLSDKVRVIVFSASEVEENIKKQINASLTKSTTSNEHLLKTIKNAINTSGRAGNG